VQKTVAAEFSRRLVDLTLDVRLGDPLEPETDLGTLICESAAVEVERRVWGAITDGAQSLTPMTRCGAQISPVVLTGVSCASALIAQETFGPVAPIIAFETLDEAISIANMTGFALSAGVCSDDWSKCSRLIKALRAGSVNIWEVPGYRTEATPFGGTGLSGLGVKEGVIEQMRNYTNVKTYSLPW
jgi:acyl-CoA reductase-like NAD-dependent aldehyde dehydrogenase